MGNLILFAILVVFSTNLYQFTYCGGGISEAFYAFDSVQLKSAVSIRNTNARLDSIGEFIVPHFERSLAEKIVTDYFNKSMPQYLKGPNASYTVSLSFGRFVTYRVPDYGFVKDYPREVSFLLKASFGGVYNFEKKRTFRIEKGVIDG